MLVTHEGKKLMFKNEKYIAWSFLLVDILMIIGLYRIGVVEFLRINDMTYISLILMVMYVVTNMFILAVASTHYPYYISYYEKWIQYMINVFLTFGLVGTVIGFMTLFYNLFGELDFTNTDEVKRIISQMTNGIGIALLTTLVGLIASMLTYLKVTILGYKSS